MCFLLISFSSLQRETDEEEGARKMMNKKGIKDTRSVNQNEIQLLKHPTDIVDFRQASYVSALSLSRILASQMLFCRFLSRIFWSSFFSLQAQVNRTVLHYCECY